MGLIDSIYDALESEELYRLLPGTLAEGLGGRSATLLMYSPVFQLEEVMTHYFSQEMGQYYLDNQLHIHDEWTNVLRGVAGFSGEGIRISDHQSKKDFTNSNFFNQFLKYFGDDSYDCIGFIKTLSDGTMFSLGVHKGRTARNFDDKSLKMMEAISPHLIRMASLRWKLRHADATADVMASGLNSMAHAVLILNGLGEICFANAAAEALLRTGTPLSIRQGRVSAASPGLDRRLSDLIRSARGRSEPHGGAMLMPGPDGDLRVHVSPHLVGERTHVLLLVERAEIPEDARTRLMSLYELTSMEAEVAIVAAEGHSASEIGDRLRISVPTVRTHLQHVFRKMDISKASQLARLVASLPGFRKHFGE